MFECVTGLLMKPLKVAQWDSFSTKKNLLKVLNFNKPLKSKFPTNILMPSVTLQVRNVHFSVMYQLTKVHNSVLR